MSGMCIHMIEWDRDCHECEEAANRSVMTMTSRSGVNRSTDTGKPRYDLVDLGLFRRCAVHMAANVESKGENNWRNASTEDDLKRFRASAFRHFVSWFEGEDDEDHAAAVYFNIAGAEYVKEKMSEG